MVGNLTIVIPFYNGGETIAALVESIPNKFPIILVNDVSTQPFSVPEHVQVINLPRKGYFAGAVNKGIQACNTDVLVLNQDSYFENSGWIGLLEQHQDRYAFIGERIKGTHPAFGELGYIHGTFMYMRRDAIEQTGLLNEKDYPLWGCTAEWQWRVARKGFEVLPLASITGFQHRRAEGERFGSGIQDLLRREPSKRDLLVRTPPLVSVVVPCYNYGRYLSDCINSLIGGKTDLGEMPGQTLQSFEIVVVDDCSTDNSYEIAKGLESEQKGIRVYKTSQNGGTAKTLNYGIERAVGKYITFLSADDMREKDALADLVQACVQNPHSFAYDDVWLVTHGRRVRQWAMQDYDFETLLYKNHVHAGIMFPKAAWQEVGGYPEIMGNGREDWAFNVALGVHGWCGVHVRKFGYLYRRDNQNRSMTNSTEKHRKDFLDKIKSVFPSIYRGERPTMCCGKGSNKPPTMTRSTTTTVNSRSGGLTFNSLSVTTAGGSMERIEYTGNKMASTWTGPTTNKSYRFGTDRRVGWVYKQDVGERHKGGFLDMKDPATGAWLFRRHEAETVEETQPEPTPVTPEITDTEQTELTARNVTDTEEATVFEESNETMLVVEKAEPEEDDPHAHLPDPADSSVETMRSWEFSKQEWQVIYQRELAGRHRTTALKFLEEKLASD